MSAPVEVLAAMDRAVNMIHDELHTSTNTDPAAYLEEARAAVAELMETHKELLRTAKIGSLYVSGEGSDEESENLESAIQAGEAALARCGGAA